MYVERYYIPNGVSSSLQFINTILETKISNSWNKIFECRIDVRNILLSQKIDADFLLSSIIQTADEIHHVCHLHLYFVSPSKVIACFPFINMNMNIDIRNGTEFCIRCSIFLFYLSFSVFTSFACIKLVDHMLHVTK